MGKKKKDKPQKPKGKRPCFKCRLCGCRWVSDSDPHCWLCNDVLGIPQNKEAEKLIDDRSKKDGHYFKDAV
jgi:hypothetical protein